MELSTLLLRVDSEKKKEAVLTMRIREIRTSAELQASNENF